MSDAFPPSPRRRGRGGGVPSDIGYRRSDIRPRERGFTLVELIVVVLIVGLIMMLAATRLDFMVPKYRLRGAAREVASTAKQGKARAAATGRDVYLEVDLSRGQYWLLVAFPKPPEERASELEANALEYQPVLQRALPEGVQFTDVIFSEKDVVTSGRARMRLSPFGASMHAIFNLKGQDDRELAVRVNGLTGDVSFFEGHRDGDKLLEDSGP